MKRLFGILLLLLLVLAACSPSVTPAVQTKMTVPNPTPSPTALGEPALRTLAQKRGIMIGAAVNVDALEQDTNYATTLAREFNEVTPENVMKFDATNPDNGVYTFTQADELVSFAQAHAMRIRGHNLVWHEALPPWIANGTFSRVQLMAIMKDHITTLVSHYRTQVNIWDVVNEAINEDGSLRNSLWLHTIGPEYIDMAFRWAHAANPQAHLFYNDYGAEGLGVKSDAVYALVRGMLQRGVPIYGVGLQMHVDLTSPPPVQDVLTNMKRLAALGLKVEITEMDVKLQNDSRPLPARLQAEGVLYQDMLGACLAVKACDAFVIWGFTDRYSWIPSATGHADEPLIFDDSYRPKPAFTDLEKAFMN